MYASVCTPGERACSRRRRGWRLCPWPPCVSPARPQAVLSNASARRLPRSPPPRTPVCVCVCWVCLLVCVRVTFFSFSFWFTQCRAPHHAPHLLAFARICSLRTQHACFCTAFAHAAHAHDTLVSALLRTAFADCSTCVCVCARARASVCVRMFPYVSVCVRKCPHVSVCSAQHFYWQLWEIRQLIRTWRILILSFLILLYTYTYEHHIYM